jgi:hypothetical protein
MAKPRIIKVGGRWICAETIERLPGAISATGLVGQGDSPGEAFRLWQIANDWRARYGPRIPDWLRSLLPEVDTLRLRRAWRL